MPSNLSGQITHTIDNDRDLKILEVEVHTNKVHFNIINIYTPHGLNIQNINNFINNLNHPTIIFGDFNLHHHLWRANYQIPLSENFVKWLYESNYIILNTPTYIVYSYNSSLTDLTLCSESIYNKIDCHVVDCIFERDHLPIFSTWFKILTKQRTIKTIKWNPIAEKSIGVLIYTKGLDIDKFTNHISNIIKEITTQKTIKSDCPHWRNIASHNCSSLKNLSFKKAGRKISSPDWNKYKKFRSTLKFNSKKA